MYNGLKYNPASQRPAPWCNICMETSGRLPFPSQPFIMAGTRMGNKQSSCFCRTLCCELRVTKVSRTRGPNLCKVKGVTTNNDPGV
jgi:hypothetical protein